MSSKFKQKSYFLLFAYLQLHIRKEKSFVNLAINYFCVYIQLHTCVMVDYFISKNKKLILKKIAIIVIYQFYKKRPKGLHRSPPQQYQSDMNLIHTALINEISTYLYNFEDFLKKNKHIFILH